MSGVLLDTHIWAWSLVSPARLSQAAISAMESTSRICVSTISLFEIGQKVRLGKWEEMAPYVNQLINLADEQSVELIPVSSAISSTAAVLDWPHRDPFDRLIGATAITEGLTLISADSAFDHLGTATFSLARLR